MTVPHEPNGYAVDVRANLAHKRWADHAIGLTRTTASGLSQYLVDPRPCVECWPPPTSEEPGYFCAACNRRHIEGSAIYLRHQDVEPSHSAETEGS